MTFRGEEGGGGGGATGQIRVDGRGKGSDQSWDDVEERHAAAVPVNDRDGHSSVGDEVQGGQLKELASFEDGDGGDASVAGRGCLSSLRLNTVLCNGGSCSRSRSGGGIRTARVGQRP